MYYFVTLLLGDKLKMIELYPPFSHIVVSCLLISSAIVKLKLNIHNEMFLL